MKSTKDINYIYFLILFIFLQIGVLILTKNYWTMFLLFSFFILLFFIIILFYKREQNYKKMLLIQHNKINQIEDNYKSLFLNSSSDIKPRSYIDIAGVIIFTLDKNGNITMINKKGYLTLGYNFESELLGVNIFENFSADFEKEKLITEYNNIINDNTIIEKFFSSFVISKTGESSLISWHAYVIRDKKGVFSNILVSGEDITKYNKLQIDMNNFFELSSDMLAITSRQNFIKVSPSWEKHLGWSKTELMSKNVKELILKKDLKYVYHIFYRANKEKNSKFSFVLRILSKTGEYRWTEWNCAFDSNNETIFSSGRDITEAKLKEQNLKKQIKKAEEIEKIKNKFWINISHEIRTPLTAIIGLSEALLKEHTLEPRQKYYIDNIAIAGKNLLSIINNILDFSKIEYTKTDIEEIEFSLYDMFNYLSAIFSNEISRKNIRMSLSIDNDVPHFIISDQVKLTRILTNLVGNAVKFTDKGFISIKLSLLDKSDNCLNLLFSVTDTGIGISSEKIEHIFEPFLQEDNTITRKYGGTGLGLAISQRLVKILNGKIWVESQKLKGSTFSFTIMCKPSSARSLDFSNLKNIDINNLKSYSGIFSGINILIGEDQHINQSILKCLFEESSANIFFANNGLDVISKLSKQKFNLIILDIQMPLLDGYETSKKIRKISKYKNIPIIAVTASITQNEINKCFESGMNFYISKPINKNELYDKSIKALNINNYSIFQNNNSSAVYINEIEGLNMELLLYRLENNYNLIKELLNLFYKRFIPFNKKIIPLISNNNNVNELLNEIHSLRGCLSNISAEEIAEYAYVIESEIKQNIIDNKKITHLISLINSLLDNISKSRFFNGDTLNYFNLEKFNKKYQNEVLKWLDNLVSALNNYDINAVNIFELHYDKINVAEFIEEVEIIKSSIYNNEFKNAAYYSSLLIDKIK